MGNTIVDPRDRASVGGVYVGGAAAGTPVPPAAPGAPSQPRVHMTLPTSPHTGASATCAMSRRSTAPATT